MAHGVPTVLCYTIMLPCLGWDGMCPSRRRNKWSVVISFFFFLDLVLKLSYFLKLAASNKFHRLIMETSVYIIPRKGCRSVTLPVNILGRVSIARGSTQDDDVSRKGV